MRFKAVIFDLDGTLLNTLRDIADSANRVLGREGFTQHVTEAYKQFVGDGARMMLQRALPENARDNDTVTRCVQMFREEYARRWDVATRLYEGIAEMLDELTLAGIKMAVLSNKPDNFTRQCASRYLAHWRFYGVSGHRKDIPLKPDPKGALLLADVFGESPERIVFLGDSDVDMHTAVAAGMFPSGALWGFRSRLELQAGGARILVENPAQFLSFFQRANYGRNSSC